MKRTNLYFLMVAALATGMFSSCNNNDEYYLSNMYPDAMVTVKTAENGRIYLQLDDETTLLAANLTRAPFGGKEVRALTNFRTIPEVNAGYDKTVYVNWLDSIRTKGTEPFIEGENDALYGTAPVEIFDDWVTVVEDGYLTLHLNLPWGHPSRKHYVHLLTGGNPDNPYEVELRHDAGDDACSSMRSAMVAFRLDELPDTEGETVKLKLVWKSPRGNRSAEFDYRTRDDGE